MWLALSLAGGMAEVARAQTAPSPDYDALWRRVEQQSAEIEELKARLAELPVIPAGHVEWSESTDDNCVPVPTPPSVPVVVQPPGHAQCSDSEAAAAKSWNLRYSTVRSDYGFGNEYAVGASWYPQDTPLLKVTLDVTRIERSPLNNTTSDILVGEDGLLIRTQFQAEFNAASRNNGGPFRGGMRL